MISIFKNLPDKIQQIAKKIVDDKRLDPEEIKYLYMNADLSLLGLLANYLNKKINGNKVFYNRNYHIEPSNICDIKCKFCSFSAHNSPLSWDYSVEEIMEDLASKAENITEVHIVGGCHPGKNLHFYCDLFSSIKNQFPHIAIKALTAVEIKYIAQLENIDTKEVLIKLKERGLISLTGGGAEIFNHDIRQILCPNKGSAEEWLNVHRQAHQVGVSSTATILYGHIESVDDRIDHLLRIRTLQDETNLFKVFIPLKFKRENNEFQNTKELSLSEDLRFFALCRIVLDNIPNLKAYWPMLGKQQAQLLLDYGVNDLDGTINDSTKIYSLAGAEELNPSMSVEELKCLVEGMNKEAVERDSLYKEINNTYSN